MKKLFVHQLLIVASFAAMFFSACNRKQDPVAIKRFFEGEVQDWNHKLTQVIIADIFTPAACSRIFAYSNIAFYEALRNEDTAFSSYAGKLNKLGKVPAPNQKVKYSYPISGVIAFTTVAERLVFNSNAIKQLEKQYIFQLDSLNIDDELIKNSVEYGREVGKHIVRWAAEDGYLQRNSYPAYIITNEAGRYQPTPPNYTDAVETNWKTLRPFLLDSAPQFRPKAPPKYDTTVNSEFYKEAIEVYSVVKNPNPSDSAIAWYWDDNPNTSIIDGHVVYFQQKNSPPGHWVNIACNVAKKENYNNLKTASLISKTAIALADAFISAWEAKFYYNYLRPETFINKYIDEAWHPLIQTPPFPEYPSAHSAASACAATVLSKMVGDKYTFIDSAEINYGRPPRKFNSFFQASDEASISRMYGGIHFRSGLEQGKLQGRKIGAFLLDKLD